jgi:hypothetical protein
MGKDKNDDIGSRHEEELIKCDSIHAGQQAEIEPEVNKNTDRFSNYSKYSKTFVSAVNGCSFKAKKEWLNFNFVARVAVIYKFIVVIAALKIIFGAPCFN